MGRRWQHSQFEAFIIYVRGLFQALISAQTGLPFPCHALPPSHPLTLYRSSAAFGPYRGIIANMIVI